MVERTEHGEERHEYESRPMSEALQDKAEIKEIYLDYWNGLLCFRRWARSDARFYNRKFASHEFSDN